MPKIVTAKEIMTTEVVTLSARQPVPEAAALLIEKRISSAPVVDLDFTRKFLVGFVSEKDIMQCYASGRMYADPKVTVADVMRPNPVAVRPETDLYALAAIFMQHGYRHLPVVSAGMLDGIVSRRDVLAALLVDYHLWSKLDPQTRKPPDLATIFTPLYLLG